MRGEEDLPCFFLAWPVLNLPLSISMLHYHLPTVQLLEMIISCPHFLHVACLWMSHTLSLIYHYLERERERVLPSCFTCTVLSLALPLSLSEHAPLYVASLVYWGITVTQTISCLYNFLALILPHQLPTPLTLILICTLPSLRYGERCLEPTLAASCANLARERCLPYLYLSLEPYIATLVSCITISSLPQGFIS